MILGGPGCWNGETLWAAGGACDRFFHFVPAQRLDEELEIRHDKTLAQQPEVLAGGQED